jgi:hypothetical protein
VFVRNDRLEKAGLLLVVGIDRVVVCSELFLFYPLVVVVDMEGVLI